MSFEEWASQRQAKWVSRPSLVDEVVERACGHAPTTKVRVQGGAMNELWVVSAGEIELVVRIAHRSDVRLAREAWALEQCAAVGVPVARVVLFEDHTTEVEPHSILVLSKLRGDQLGHEEGPSSRPTLLAATNALGRALLCMRSVAVDGLGFADDLGKATGVGWTEPTAFLAWADGWLAEAATRGGVPVDAVNAACEYIAAYGRSARGAPCLVHADLRPAHVLVDGMEVTGIVDFEFCQGGDPVYDIAYWDYVVDDSEFTDALVDGYGAQRDASVFHEAFVCCRLMVGLQYLSWFRGPEAPWEGLGDTIASKLRADLEAL